MTPVTPPSREEDILFLKWRNSPNPDEVLPALVKVMTQHGYAVCWLKLGQKRPDIVNSAVFRALRAADDFRGEAKFSTFFHAVLLCACNSALRKITSTRKREVSLEAAENIAHECNLDNNLALQEAALALTEDEQRLLQMSCEGLDQNEIAEREGISVGAVRVRKFRLKRKLERL